MPFKDNEKRKQHMRKYYQQNKLAHLLYSQLERMAFPEIKNARNKKWREENKNTEEYRVKRRAIKKRYQEKNIDKHRKWCAEYRERQYLKDSEYMVKKKFKDRYGHLWEVAYLSSKIKKELRNDIKKKR